MFNAFSVIAYAPTPTCNTRTWINWDTVSVETCESLRAFYGGALVDSFTVSSKTNGTGGAFHMLAFLIIDDVNTVSIEALFSIGALNFSAFVDTFVVLANEAKSALSVKVAFFSIRDTLILKADEPNWTLFQ